MAIIGKTIVSSALLSFEYNNVVVVVVVVCSPAVPMLVYGTGLCTGYTVSSSIQFNLWPQYIALL